MVVAAGLMALAASDTARAGACAQTAGTVREACKRGAHEGYWIGMGNCLNSTHSQADQTACKVEVKTERQEALGECADIHEAYLDACDLLGQAPYDPVIDPNDFDSPVANPYFPLVPGTTYVYEGLTSKGLERVEVTVTLDTVEILGVKCIVVRDVGTLDGGVVEDTQDWFAMDDLGNAWYFGELSFEVEDGEIVGVGGSWKAGVDGAKPGIIMKAAPQVGDVYRQEFFLLEAEDMGEILDDDGSATVPFGTFNGTLVTRDFTPLEPEANEHKHYALGTGLVLEEDLETGERIELVDVLNGPRADR